MANHTLMSFRTKIIAAVFGLILVVAVAVFQFKLNIPKEVIAHPTGHSRCLQEGEWAGVKNKIVADEGMLSVLIGTGEEGNPQKPPVSTKLSFDVPAWTSHADSADVRKCGVYAIRKFLNPYSTQLWQYGYDGSQRKILTFIEVDADNKTNSYFQSEFSVNETESYLALIRGYLGSSDHAIVIKDLKTMEDVAVFPAAKLFADYPQIEPGDFTQMGFYENGFGFQLINTNNTKFDVDMRTWKITNVND